MGPWVIAAGITALVLWAKSTVDKTDKDTAVAKAKADGEAKAKADADAAAAEERAKAEAETKKAEAEKIKAECVPFAVALDATPFDFQAVVPALKGKMIGPTIKGLLANDKADRKDFEFWILVLQSEYNERLKISKPNDTTLRIGKLGNCMLTTLSKRFPAVGPAIDPSKVKTKPAFPGG